MVKLKEEIRTYHVKFAVGTSHTETEIKTYSRRGAKILLEKQDTDCKVTVSSEEIKEI